MSPLARAPERSPRGTCGGQDCQERRGSLAFVGVGGANEIPRETPATSRKTANYSDAGGGTRTPDTRIMIPLSETAPDGNTCKYATSLVAGIREKTLFRGRSGPTRGRSVV